MTNLIQGLVTRFDPKTCSGFVRSGVDFEWYFHMDGSCKAIAGKSEPILDPTQRLMEKPKEGDQLIFFGTSTVNGRKAKRWTFLADFQKVENEITRRERNFKQRSFPFADTVASSRR